MKLAVSLKTRFYLQNRKSKGEKGGNFHHAKNKNNYKDSISKLKKMEGYLKRCSGRQLT
jgi:hypothetical protein